LRVRFPVQWVIRGAPDRAPDYRAYAGRVDGGVLRPGDPVVVLPGGVTTRIEAIDTFDGPIAEAFPPMSVAVRLADEVDLGRGGLLAAPDDAPDAVVEFPAVAAWLGDAPLRVGARYWLRHTTRQVRAVVASVDHRIDVANLERRPGADGLAANDIGRVRVRVAEPIFADAYRANRATGSAILVDEATNATVAALLVAGDGEDLP
jgi:sulfate adenylyltransferase subunit 1 (EFTu-like GTPase family)